MADEEALSETLSEFARTILTDFPIQAILEHLVTRIVEIMPITAAGVTLISHGSDPVYIAASNRAARNFEKLQSELTEGPCMSAYETGEPVSVPDLANDERYAVFRPRALAVGLRAVFTFPLRDEGRRLGALDLYRDTPGELDTAAMRAAQTLADVASAYILNARARTELQLSADRNRVSSLHDALTGLPNRVLLRERLDHALRKASRSHNWVAVLFVDLDRFKEVNDTYGHQTGDELLIAIADRLTRMLRPGDTLARLSGDEFVVLCEDLRVPSQANLIADRLVETIGQPFVVTATELRITASVGIAVAEWRDKPEHVLHAADLAMYQAKRKGGGASQVIDLLEQEIIDEGESLEYDLRVAVERDELRAVYQPIIRAVDGHITGAEALLRWDHPDRGAIAPSVLIPLAERSGLINDIGNWILGRACRDRRRWVQELADPAFAISVNVSVNQLFSRDFTNSVAEILRDTETDPALVTLEVTESIFLEDSERALIVLNRLKHLGVMLALDDFGTGYSSLSYLKHFPFDIVKIDRAFVVDVARDPPSRAIVAAIIELAQALRMTVVAEGVETTGQFENLAALKCESLQGFYFAKPMPAQELLELLHAGHGDIRLAALAHGS